MYAIGFHSHQMLSRMSTYRRIWTIVLENLCQGALKLFWQHMVAHHLSIITYLYCILLWKVICKGLSYTTKHTDRVKVKYTVIKINKGYHRKLKGESQKSLRVTF